MKTNHENQVRTIKNNLGLMGKLITALLLTCGFAANATTYYVSASGNDANNGTSTSTPWRTLAKVNSYFSSLQPGDNVLLNRGEVFYGSIIVNENGTSGSPITVGAYGSGADPVITGFTTISSWTNLGSNIWESSASVSTLARTNMVFANGSYAPMGRYPNTGWLTYQSESVSGANISVTSSSLSGSWAGAEIFIYANRYAFDKAPIKTQSGGTLTFTSTTNPVYDQKNPSFFIQNDPRTLDATNEWYYNPSTKKLRIYSTSTPQNVQISTVNNLVSASGHSYITFDNISFLGANGSTIQLGNSQYITLQNCSIDYSGQDAVNGSSNGTSPGLTVQNCSINHSNNYGISLKSNFTNAVIQSNTINNTGWVPGMSGVNAMGVDAQGNNTRVSYNNISNTCYVGIQFFGNGTIISNNYVTNFNVLQTDGGGIYTWNGHGGTIKSGVQILNNIVINPGNDNTDVGIYLDDWSNGIEVNGNTVSGCGTGISGGNSFNIKYKNNTCYNNIFSQMFILRAPTPPIPGQVSLDNIEMKNNIFFLKQNLWDGAGVHTMFIEDPAAGSQLPTHFNCDSNYYIAPIAYTKGSIYTYFNSAGADRYLASWQAYSGQDAHSKETPKVITDPNDIRFEYNATSSSKTISLSYNYIDARNKSYNGTITLAPYTSAVLIKNGAATGNIPPTASAGSDQTITLPTSSVTLTGSGSDPDGSIASYSWVKISGNGGSIAAPASAVTSVSGLTQGVYQFQLTVTDNKGAIATDNVQVIVNNNTTPDNIPPTASAGSNQTITLPTSSVTLTGSGSDPDGSIASYSWVKISGNGGAIGAPASAVTSVSGLTQGVYQFQLTVTDNKGATATDNVQVTVNDNTTPDDLLPAVNPANTVNGMDYAYYAIAVSTVPDFSTLTPAKTSAGTNFDISPAIKTAGFAFNFTGYIDVPADGQYTFYTTSDDGSNLYIDNVLVVNNDGLHSAREESGVIGLKAGKHYISVGYFQSGINKTLSVSYSGPGVPKQVIPASALYIISSDDLLPAVNPANTVNGLDYAYYQKGYSVVPDFSLLTPDETGTSATCDISLANRATGFALNFTGYVNVPADGHYTFYTTSDDGSNLYIDNVLVVDNDGLHSATEESGVIGLKAGKHAISVGYFQSGIDKTLTVSYAGAGIAKQLIPASAFYRVSVSGLALDNKNQTTISLQPGIKIYPNPFANYIEVNIAGGVAGRYKLMLVDPLGRVVWTKSSMKDAGPFHETINTSALLRGIYFLKVIQNNTSSVIKLVK